MMARFKSEHSRDIRHRDPHRYLFWLEHLEGQLRVAGVERLTSARQVST
jgi:hypothetical protein